MIHPRLTLSQQFAEREHRISNRLGSLCEDGPITESARQIAESEADAWVREYNGVKPPEPVPTQQNLF